MIKTLLLCCGLMLTVDKALGADELFDGDNFNQSGAKRKREDTANNKNKCGKYEISKINDLTDDALTAVFSFLPIKDSFNILSINQLWNEIGKNGDLWKAKSEKLKPFFEKDFFTNNPYESIRSIFRPRFKELNLIGNWCFKIDFSDKYFMNYAGTAAVLPIENEETEDKGVLLWSQSKGSKLIKLDRSNLDLTGISNDGQKFIGNKYIDNRLTQGYIYTHRVGFEYLPMLNNGTYCEVKSIHQNGIRLLGFAENGLNNEFTLVQWKYNLENGWQISALDKGAITNLGDTVYIERMFADEDFTYIALNLSNEYEGNYRKAALWTETTGFIDVEDKNLTPTLNGALPNSFFEGENIVSFTSAAPNGVWLGGIEEVWGDDADSDTEYDDIPSFPCIIKGIGEKFLGVAECKSNSLTSANGRIVIPNKNEFVVPNEDEIMPLFPKKLRNDIGSIRFKCITPSGLKALGITDNNTAIITSLSYNLDDDVNLSNQK